MERNTVVYEPPELVRLEQLALLCQKLAEHLGLVDSSNQRVQWVLQPRLIRYYTTLGLLDRPAEMRGRTAFYSRRHLLQVLTIKRLQQIGKSLDEVQQQLLGCTTDSMLSTLGLGPDWEAVVNRLQLELESPGATGLSPPVDEQLPTRRDRFWDAPVPEPPEGTQQCQTVESKISPEPQFHSLVRVQLANGTEIHLPLSLYEQVGPERLSAWLQSFPAV
jgi:DNA-binding transcriptional MerR regulator